MKHDFRIRGHLVGALQTREEIDRTRTHTPIAWDEEHVGVTQTRCCNKILRLTQQEYEACQTVATWGDRQAIDVWPAW